MLSLDPLMEPITHFLTGACIGRAGFNRKTAYATLAAALAAEAADLDVFWGFGGPVEELKHHRGITHTFLGAPFVAFATVAVVGGIYAWRQQPPCPRASPKPPTFAPAPPPPVALGLALPHRPRRRPQPHPPRLDQQLRRAPILSLQPPLVCRQLRVHRRTGALGLACSSAIVLPWLFGLADREIGARRTPFRGRGWAIFALAAMVVVGCWRWAEHAQARAMVQNDQIATAPVLRMAVEPYPVNPLRWHAILETPGYYQTAEVNTRTGTIDCDPQTRRALQAHDTPAVEAAKRTFLGQVYLDWGTWAVVRDMGQIARARRRPARPAPAAHVDHRRFTDLRFAYAFSRGGSSTPVSGLTGWVYIVDDRDDAGESMGGREQK